jgi:hypothetical protein
MSDASFNWDNCICTCLLFFVAGFFIILVISGDAFLAFGISAIVAIVFGIIAGYSKDFNQRDSRSTDDETLDIYMPIETVSEDIATPSSLERWPSPWASRRKDAVTPIYGIEEIGKYAECPYCGSNIRETFYKLSGIVRCDKCGAFHHKDCFEFFGGKCGSPTCKL